MNSGMCNVLLIDDDVDDADMITHALKKLSNIEIFHIDDGVDALNYLFSGEHLSACLILLDVKMPKVDGIEILKRLKNDALLSKIPVVMMISSEDGKRYVKSFGFNPDGFITKPVRTDHFLQVLADLGCKNRDGVKILERQKPWPNIGDW
jgi:two-component system response regulator